MKYILYLLFGAGVAIAFFAFLDYTKPATLEPNEPSAATTSPLVSGIRGAVLLGPQCSPVQNQGNPACADRPYEAAVALYADGATVPLESTRSDNAGNFAFAVPPGEYFLQGVTGRVLPDCGSASVAVPEQGYALVTIYCDTGVR